MRIYYKYFLELLLIYHYTNFMLVYETHMSLI
jgi:hypothetical protein